MLIEKGILQHQDLQKTGKYILLVNMMRYILTQRKKYMLMRYYVLTEMITKNP